MNIGYTRTEHKVSSDFAKFLKEMGFPQDTIEIYCFEQGLLPYVENQDVLAYPELDDVKNWLIDEKNIAIDLQRSNGIWKTSDGERNFESTDYWSAYEMSLQFACDKLIEEDYDTNSD